MTNRPPLRQKRPLLHYSPPKNWMNDPNGLVHYQGEFHLFYQHNPHDSVWGEMHWGHAVSKDGLHWDDKGIALSPRGGLHHIFSGCGVIDRNNSSGFFPRSRGIVLLYTGVSREEGTNKNVENQYIAYLDEETGKVLVPESNRVLENPGLEHFRDPKVIYLKQRDCWMMVLACGGHVRFYTSKNLGEWTLKEKYYPQGFQEDQVIECPGIFESKDPSGASVWVLVMSILNEKTRESETFYLTGEWEGYRFIPHGNPPRRVDSGHDFYAPQHWESSESSSRKGAKSYWIGWMNNWAYANDFPAAGWNGIMSMVRETALVKKGEALLLSQKPLSGIVKERTRKLPEITRGKELRVNFPKGAAYEIRMTIKNPQKDRITLGLWEKTGKEFTFTIHGKDAVCSLDRSRCGIREMAEKGLVVKSSPLNILPEYVDLIMIIDLWTIEIFLDQGTVVFSEMLHWEEYPDSFYIRTKEADAAILDFNCWELSGASPS